MKNVQEYWVHNLQIICEIGKEENAIWMNMQN